jgi:hypothetical protein
MAAVGANDRRHRRCILLTQTGFLNCMLAGIRARNRRNHGYQKRDQN